MAKSRKNSKPAPAAKTPNGRQSPGMRRSAPKTSTSSPRPPRPWK